MDVSSRAGALSRRVTPVIQVSHAADRVENTRIYSVRTYSCTVECAFLSSAAGFCTVKLASPRCQGAMWVCPCNEGKHYGSTLEHLPRRTGRSTAFAAPSGDLGVRLELRLRYDRYVPSIGLRNQSAFIGLHSRAVAVLARSSKGLCVRGFLLVIANPAHSMILRMMPTAGSPVQRRWLCLRGRSGPTTAAGT
eukprot:SAG25_NODE_209_length_11844_cov_3.436782_6_plen_193_part_00